MKISHKTKFFYVILALLVFIPYVVDAQVATTKADAGDAATQTTETINQQTKNAWQKIKKFFQNAVNKVKGWYEDGMAFAAPHIETAKAVREDVSTMTEATNSMIASGQSVYNDTKGAVDYTASQAGGVVNDAKNKANEAAAQASGVASQATDMASPVTQAASVQAEYNELKTRMDERKEAVTKEVQSKSIVAQENITNLEKMLNQVKDEETKALINEQLEAAKEEAELYQAAEQQLKENPEAYLQNDDEYAQLNEKFQSVETEMNSMLADAAGLAIAAAKNLFSMSDSEKKAAYDEISANNFLGRDEVETPKNNERILKHRQQVLVKDAAHAMTMGINYKKGQPGKEDKSDMTAKNIAAAEYQQTGVNLLIEQRIDDLNILYNLTELIIADLRVKTAQDMMALPAKRSNYDLDPTVLRLEDYTFTEDDIGSDEDKVNPLDEVFGRK